MKLAFNGPLELMKKYDWGHDHYALAHECLKDDKLVKFYAKSKKTVILDNGADEIVEGLGGDVLQGLIEKIRPDYCILPDVLENAALTRERSLEFLARSKELKHKPKWMAVIQGTTLDEWTNELYFWLADPNVSLIGIPYDINFEVPNEMKMSTKARQWAYRRTYLLAQACTLRMNSWGDKRIHLLGMNDLCEFQMMRASVDPIVLDLIRSNDTTAPYAAAAADRMFMMEKDLLTSGEKDWPSLDFQNEDIDTSTLVWNLCLYYWAALPDQQDNWPPAVRTMLETLLAFGFGE